jgi:nucleoside-diphosphate-sugar epimerase
VILLSVPGASLDHAHPFLRAKGLAEEVVLQSGLEHAELRASHAYGLGGLWFTSTVAGADHGFVVGDGTQRWAPVLADDVAQVVAAIDDRHDPVEGVWSIGGPEGLAADEVFAIVGEGGDARHLDPDIAAERLTTLLEIPVSTRTTEYFAMSSVPDAPDAGAVFGIPRTSFEEGLRGVAARVAEGG